jgi:mannose-6-phosphate isomerase-like protein (cupin superfamily)
VIVHDLSVNALHKMIGHDLANADHEPDSPISEFDFHGCAAAVACFIGQPPWERHTGGDELLLVLAGETELTVGGEPPRSFGSGAMIVVPSGQWHRNNAPNGVTVFHLTPTTGNEHSWERPDPD